MFCTFVQCNYCNDRKNPDFHRIFGCIKIQMFVTCDARFICACKTPLSLSSTTIEIKAVENQRIVKTIIHRNYTCELTNIAICLSYWGAQVDFRKKIFLSFEILLCGMQNEGNLAIFLKKIFRNTKFLFV